MIRLKKGDKIKWRFLHPPSIWFSATYCNSKEYGLKLCFDSSRTGLPIIVWKSEVEVKKEG